MKKIYSNATAIALITASLTMVSLLSGCGGQADDLQSEQPASESGPSKKPTSPPPNDPTSNLPPPVQISVTLTGALGSTPSVVIDTPATDSKLKVRITAGPASRLTVPGSSGSMVYGCVSFQIGVGESAATMRNPVNTGILKVPGANNSNCSSAPESKVIDSSSQLGGLTTPKIIVKDVQNDFYCNLHRDCKQKQLSGYWAPECEWTWYSGESLYCPLRAAYSTHTATANLSIGVNGTQEP